MVRVRVGVTCEKSVAILSSPMRYSKGSDPKSIAKKCDGSI